MFKMLTIGSIVAGSLLATAVTGQAREISVWGNTFTVNDGASAVQAAPIAPRLGATVANPERFMRHHQRLNHIN